VSRSQNIFSPFTEGRDYIMISLSKEATLWVASKRRWNVNRKNTMGLLLKRRARLQRPMYL